MKALNILIVTFLLIFILVICTLRVYATNDTLEINGIILNRKIIQGISKIQKPIYCPFQKPLYCTLSTVKNDSDWYFIIYYKTNQPRYSAIISAKSKYEIEQYHKQVNAWLNERN